ncbi:MAG: hypothetical protein A4E49_01953 [Methanosaeta sp. PtaU1.Bin112]|nr:MAG: hypothetical protein A4E49_01953 [Methanosaeta sp. PtaU1.Bin112]
MARHKAVAEAKKAPHLAVRRVPVRRTLWNNPVLFALKPGFMSSFGLGQASHQGDRSLLKGRCGSALARRRLD